MATTGLLDRLEAEGNALIVPMNGCNILTYKPGKYIGTRDLNSCIAVVIQSQVAIVLAHISPRPRGAPQNDLTAGDRHMAEKMDEVLQLYRTYQRYFSAGTNGVGIYAVYVGHIALPSQKAIIERKLSGAGLTAAASTYVVPTTESNSPGRGTVLAGWPSDPRFCDIFVEDIPRYRIQVAQQYIDQFLASAAASSSRATVSSARPAGSSSRAAASYSRAAVSSARSAVSSPRTTASGDVPTLSQVGRATLAVLQDQHLSSYQASTLLSRFVTQQAAALPATATEGAKKSCYVQAARMSVMSRGNHNEAQAQALISAKLQSLMANMEDNNDEDSDNDSDADGDDDDDD